ncbi:MAG: chromate transporter [Clostridiales bacterium]|nr:chromate transporter [Clostridiales bacterium]
MIFIELFLAFAQIAMFSICGGYTAMPLIRAQVVDAHGWMTMGEFADLITIAEMTPGPIQLNAATFAGTRVAGLGGAVCATMGVVAPSLVLVSLLAWVYGRYRNMAVIKGILGMLRPAVVALIASAGVSLVRQAAFGGHAVSLESIRPRGMALFAIAMFLLRKRRLSPIATIALCGAIALVAGVLFGGI